MKWVSVTESLPEYQKQVLVYIKSPNWLEGKIELGKRKYTDHEGEHWDIDYNHFLTHWMPLPEPPDTLPEPDNFLAA